MNKTFNHYFYTRILNTDKTEDKKLLILQKILMKMSNSIYKYKYTDGRKV